MHSITSSPNPRTKSAPKTLKILSIVFGSIGLAMWLISSGIYLYGTFFSANTAKTEGTVISLNRQSGRSSPVVAPVVEYSVSGIKYQHTASVYTSTSSYKVGDRVTVLYDPSKPQNSQLSFEIGELLTLIFGIIGTAFVVISGIILLISLILVLKRANRAKRRL